MPVRRAFTLIELLVVMGIIGVLMGLAFPTLKMVQASSRPGDWVLDAFAGSGTLGAVAHQLGRRFVLVDRHPEAIRIMRQRLPASTRFIEMPAPGSAS